jgi:hypothetical protein
MTTVSKPNSNPARLAVTITVRFFAARFVDPVIVAPVYKKSELY